MSTTTTTIAAASVAPASDALSRVAMLPGRQFRTMLRFLSKGLHFEQAHVLLRVRATTGLELLADDVNTVLSAILFTDAQRFALQFLANLKREGRLSVPVEDAVVAAEASRALAAWSVGAYNDLDAARYQRSPEIHSDKAAERARGGASKRLRGDDGGGDGDGAREGGAGGGDEVASDAVQAHAVRGGVRGDTQGDAAATDAAASAACESEAFKRLSARILEENDVTDATGVRWQHRRFERARTLFGSLSAGDICATGPNARSFVLMLHGAEAAGHIEEGRRVYARMVGANGSGGDGGGDGSGVAAAVCAPEDLYTVVQPSLLQRLAAAGILPADVAAGALVAEPDTPKWFFLKAAFEATKGDQFGSKHGVVLTKGGRYLAHGHNHRFGVAGDKHLRVMHSEVHALVKLENEADALGAEAWIVELDGKGVGYEEAVACVMCNKALCRLGLQRQHFSAGNGVRSQTSAHRPALICESYEMAKRRIYPPGTQNPDVDDERGFDFRRAADPGRGARGRE